MTLAALKAILTIADGFSESTMNDLTDTTWQHIYQHTKASNKLHAIHSK